MNQLIKNLNKLKGEVELPGDKSISHRALIFSAMSEGESEIRNLASGADIRSTLNCLKQLGVKIRWKDNVLIVKGVGYKGFKTPVAPLDAGNSATTARLLAGLLAAQPFDSIITGDQSLLKRPMKRIIEPLRMMGAAISGTSSDTLPLEIIPVSDLMPLEYRIPVASAQVKSALILAALHSDEESVLIETRPTRDHTERMLSLNAEQNKNEKVIKISREKYPSTAGYKIPGDISSSAFLIVASLINQGSEVRIKNISLNPSRIEFLNILKKMGGEIEIIPEGIESNEPYGDLIVKSGLSKNTHIDVNVIPLIIDEIPVLSVAGIFAEGSFVLRGASELRVKESDRIDALCSNFRILGLDVEQYEDGFEISGTIKNNEPVLDSFGDHRIAMAMAVLLSAVKQGGVVKNFDCVGISNPDFLSQLYSLAE
ncbi:MAG: 3-phosphoshikimate 1-carboxyvinyltransferase [Ignavibacteriaceae bacterium]